MRQPFPLALHIGTDIVHLPRLVRLVSRKPSSLDRFARRILRTAELDDFRARFPAAAAAAAAAADTTSAHQCKQRSARDTLDMARWLAGRFAAKEAARKAVPAGAASIGWKDVLVHVPAAGAASSKPEIVFMSAGQPGAPPAEGRLSISHDGDYVVATVLAAAV